MTRSTHGNLQRKQRGKVIISRDMLFEADPGVLEAIFSVFYPINIIERYDYGYKGNLEYYGWSLWFDEIYEGEEVPEYRINVSTMSDGSYGVETVEKIIKHTNS